MEGWPTYLFARIEEVLGGTVLPVVNSCSNLPFCADLKYESSILGNVAPCLPKRVVFDHQIHLSSITQELTSNLLECPMKWSSQKDSL